MYKGVYLIKLYIFECNVSKDYNLNSENVESFVKVRDTLGKSEIQWHSNLKFVDFVSRIDGYSKERWFSCWFKN